MRTKLDIITNIQLVLWVMIIGLCGGIEFLHGWNIRITGNGPIREGHLATMESVRRYIWSELHE